MKVILKSALIFALLGAIADYAGILISAGRAAAAGTSAQIQNQTAERISDTDGQAIRVSARARESPEGPRISCATGTKGIFFGINGHVYLPGVYKNTSYATQLSQLRDLGITMYRQDVSSEEQIGMITRLASAAKIQCIDVIVVLTPDYQHKSDEAASYRDGYTLARAAAMKLRGLVQYYEVGNEYDNNAILQGRHGNHPSDYDNARFVKARGAILGMIDGVKAGDPSAKIVLCGLGWLHYGFSDMLYTGSQPDGSGRHRIPKWDITAWHWYSEMDDITSAGIFGVDVLQHLRDTYGKPIWITEFGVRPDKTEDYAGQYLVGKFALGGFVENARKYDIQSVELYELYDDGVDGGDGTYGVIDHDGKTRKARYDMVKTFIRTHPDPWGG